MLVRLLRNAEPFISCPSFNGLIGGGEAADESWAAYGERMNTVTWTGIVRRKPLPTPPPTTTSSLLSDVALFQPQQRLCYRVARRVEFGTPKPTLLHISGCTNLVDRPLTEGPFPDREWHDAKGDAVHGSLRRENERESYAQRKTDVGVPTAAEEAGVQEFAFNTPYIFGEGTKLVNKQGFIIHSVLRFVVIHGHGFRSNGASYFTWVHVQDVADVYCLLVLAILKREDRGVGSIPSGKPDIVFPAVK